MFHLSAIETLQTEFADIQAMLDAGRRVRLVPAQLEVLRERQRKLGIELLQVLGALGADSDFPPPLSRNDLHERQKNLQHTLEMVRQLLQRGA